MLKQIKPVRLEVEDISFAATLGDGTGITYALPNLPADTKIVIGRDNTDKLTPKDFVNYDPETGRINLFDEEKKISREQLEIVISSDGERGLIREIGRNPHLFLFEKGYRNLYYPNKEPVLTTEFELNGKYRFRIKI